MYLKYAFNECLIFHVRYDVGFVDVVIFDCSILFGYQIIVY